LSLGNRQESRAVWLGYSLFGDQNLPHCKGDVKRRRYMERYGNVVKSSMYMERYGNVAQYFGDYPPNSIPTDFQKHKINTAIHCLCYRHKQTHTAQQQNPFDFYFPNTNVLMAAIYGYRPVQTVSDRTHRW
jgi:hypothetical protein